jgi:hypothetical protein
MQGSTSCVTCPHCSAPAAEANDAARRSTATAALVVVLIFFIRLRMMSLSSGGTSTPCIETQGKGKERKGRCSE